MIGPHPASGRSYATQVTDKRTVRSDPDRRRGGLWCRSPGGDSGAVWWSRPLNRVPRPARFRPALRRCRPTHPLWSHPAPRRCRPRQALHPKRPTRPPHRRRNRPQRPGPRQRRCKPPIRPPSASSCKRSSAGWTRRVGIAHAGDGSGRLFIVEKAGRIRIVRDGALLPHALPRHQRPGWFLQQRAGAAGPGLSPRTMPPTASFSSTIPTATAIRSSLALRSATLRARPTPPAKWCC